MIDPLHPALWRHLRTVQRSTSVGVHAFFRAHPLTLRTERSMYRWQRSLGDAFLIIPILAVERLGLVHAHVFVTGAGDDWLSLPYGVEAAWVTKNLCHDTLYLHCLVPKGHVPFFLSLLRTLHADAYDIVWSGTGWQQLLNPEEAVEVPVPDAHGENMSLLRQHPFLVPVIAESWRYPNSLPLIWHRIRSTLAGRLPSFLPRTRIHHVNGSMHVTNTYRFLQTKGLLRQQLIRYHPLLAASVELFLEVTMDRAEFCTLLETLRSSLHAVETYSTSDGYLCRLLGPHRLLDAILGLPESVRSRARRVLFHTKRRPTPVVRFAYEQLFDPTTGAWTVPS